MAARRRYSDNDKAAALAAIDANGGNVALTAQQIGIPSTTLDEWVKGRVSHDVPKLREEKRLDIAERLEVIAHQLLDAIPTKLDGATLQHISVSLGIALDKMQLLRGKPTTINREDGPLSDDERRELDELLRKRGEAPAGTPATDAGA